MAWEICMSNEGWNNVYENLHEMDNDTLARALAYDDYEKLYEIGDGDVDKAFEGYKAKYAGLTNDVLADECYQRVYENNTCVNGGHFVYVDKDGYILVPVDRMVA